MKKLIFTLIISGIIGSSFIYADDDRYEEGYEKEKKSFFQRFFSKFEDDEDEEYEKHYYKKSVKLKQYQELYKNECGSCHMAYQPKFLGSKDWTKLMNNLKAESGNYSERGLKILNYGWWDD